MPKVRSKPKQTHIVNFLSSSSKLETRKLKNSNGSNGLRQATIQSLQRVVNVDHIIRCKEILQDATAEKDVMISTLQELGEKIPSREVLLNTKIGHTIRKLLKHQDKDIRDHAQSIYNKWKNFFLEQSNKTVIDVKCNKATDNCRISARTHLATTLGVSEDHRRVLQFEKEAFHLCKTMSLLQYKRIMRAIILKARTDVEIRTHIMDNTKTTNEIVDMFK